MLSRAVLGNHESEGLASLVTKAEERKREAALRETLKKPPSLICKSSPSEEKEGRKGNEREKD